MAADLVLPILRHHAAVPFEVFDAREIEPVELEVEAVLLGGLLQCAHAFGHHFLADTVARYDGDAIGLFHADAPSTRRLRPTHPAALSSLSPQAGRGEGPRPNATS